MEEIKDLIPFIQYLLTGFMAAWIFYGLTSYPKPSAFERIIQALVFTAFTQTMLQAIKFVSFLLGRYLFTLDAWSNNYEIFWSGISAIIIGLSFSYYANNDSFHKILRKHRITKQASYSSEWYGAFLELSYVVLHLDGERRLYGWIVEWPSEPDKGHFVVTDASWLTDTGEIPLSNVKRILISAVDVKMVEFMQP